MYRPKEPFIVPLELLIPEYKTVKGVPKKVYPATGEKVLCSFKTFGGTDQTVNGLYSVVDTAEIECWYRPDIKSDCRVKTADGAEYEVLGSPENISMRNQFIKAKIQRVKGGA